MTQEFSTDDLTDDELLKKCIMSLSDTILYTNVLIERQYKLEVKRDEMRRICYVYKKETPPRMRGRLIVDRAGEFISGNTPAYAGKTKDLHVVEAALRKHPRICGEDPFSEHLASPYWETPPRMRGRLSKSTQQLL